MSSHKSYVLKVDWSTSFSGLEFSGGMLQRVMITCALACEPRILIADEPTTALDVTIQAQILSLMRDLQRERKMSLILITHDLGVVAQMADEVVVMYAGKVVETGSADGIFYASGHPYTQGLKSAMPQNQDRRAQQLEPISGSPPDLFDPPKGCGYFDRCPQAMQVCDEPISALDVSVQAQVVNLLGDLKASLGLTLLFIAHDLSMVRCVSDRMGVMYLGTLVELGNADDVFFEPKHPYTELLISANPEPDPRKERSRTHTTIKGEIPSATGLGKACPFAGRCPKVMDACRSERPALRPVENRLVACHLFE